MKTFGDVSWVVAVGGAVLFQCSPSHAIPAMLYQPVPYQLVLYQPVLSQSVPYQPVPLQSKRESRRDQPWP